MCSTAGNYIELKRYPNAVALLERLAECRSQRCVFHTGMSLPNGLEGSLQERLHHSEGSVHMLKGLLAIAAFLISVGSLGLL